MNGKQQAYHNEILIAFCCVTAILLTIIYKAYEFQRFVTKEMIFRDIEITIFLKKYRNAYAYA